MKILMACGGTGGHIFPAVATAEEIKRLHSSVRILFVSSKRALDRDIFKRHDYECMAFESAPLPQGKFLPFAIIHFCLKSLRAFLDGIRLVREFDPDAVVGFGGYSSFWLLLAAIILRKRTIIHEQNVKMGKANKLLAKFADKVALSFPFNADFRRSNTLRQAQDSKSRAKSRDADSRRYVLTGNPIRNGFLTHNKDEALKFFSFKEENGLGILILGGSQGSRFLNITAVKALGLMHPGERKRLRVVHLCGQADYDSVNKAYDALGIDHRIYPFLNDMHFAYQASDMAISRCGASSIWEIAASRTASILVPYPHAGNHQLQNGLALFKTGAAVLVEEKDLTPQLLKEKILELADDKDRLEKMKEKASRAFRPDGAKRLADEILGLAGLKDVGYN